MDGSAVAATPTQRFIGRTGERTLLRHLLRDAGQGQLAIVVVYGVPGAGKTALLEWTADTARRGAAEVLWASGYEGSLPLAAVSRLVAPFRELTDVLRTAGPSGVGSGPLDTALGASATSDLPRSIVDVLVSRAHRRPLVVLLDDVQDLGDASRAVLSDTLVGLDDTGARQRLQLLVVLSARSPVESESLAGRAMRLRAARTLTLGGFDDQETFEFLAAAGRRPHRAQVRELREQTGGLPLLIESEVQRWRAPSANYGGAPPDTAADGRVRTIADALRLRFDQVDESTLRTLQRAAVLGDPWNPRELAAVAELSVAEIHAATEAAERARLVDRGGNSVRFAHPLVRAELLDRLSAAERADEHRSIAERLATHYEAAGPIDDEVHLRITDHLLRAGPAVDLELAEKALRAGRIAMRWSAYDQAARFLTAAARSAADVPADEVARRFLEAGHAAYYDYDHDLAESLLADAISYARQAGDDAVRLRAAVLLTRMRGGARTRPWDEVDVTELGDALDDHPDVDVGVLVQAEAALAEALIGSGRGDRAESILASARRSAVDVGQDRSTADALGRLDFAAGIQPLTMLDLHAADELFASALAHAVDASNPLLEALGRSRRAVVGLLRGDIGRSHAELVEVEQQTIAGGFWGEAGLAAALLAFAEVIAGSPGAAERVEPAHRRWRRTNNPWNAAILAAVVPVLVARAAAPRGRAHDTASVWAGPTDLPTPSTFTALAAVEAHDVAAVRRVLETASWRQGLRGPPTMNSIAVPTALVEVGDLLGDRAMVRNGVVALHQLDERGVRTTMPWPASVARLLAVGSRHAQDHDDARRHLRAAFHLVDREGLAPERAKCLLELARVAAASGAAGEAGTAMAEAVQAFDEQSMHGWVARCDEVGRDLRLPPTVGSSGLIRERTILTNDVVGSTLSNVRLGDVLYLEQLKVHDRILRQRLKEFRGVEIKHTGDGLNAVFNDRSDAVHCALAAQRDFDAWNRDEPELALQIRCGIAHGPLVPSGSDFYGLVQSEAARVCTLAGAGEVLATAPVMDDCPPDVVATSLGRRTLRGLPDDIEVFRLTERGPDGQ